MSKKRKAFKVTLVIFNILALAGFATGTVVFYLKYHNLQNNNLTDDQKIAKYEKEISKTFTLPKDEKPELGTVNDANTFKKTNPAFFKDLSNGDILLIYSKAPLIVVYRPSTKKIINSGPLQFTNKVAVELIGAKDDRDKAASVLNTAFSASLSIGASVDAKAPITATIVVDATGKNAELAGRVATELKGKVGQAPADQDKPADGAGIVVYVAPIAAPATTTTTSTNP